MFLKVKLWLKAWSSLLLGALFLGIILYFGSETIIAGGRALKNSELNPVLHRSSQCLSSISPYHSSLGEGDEVIHDLFEGLITYDRNRQMVGSMAQSWKSDKTGKVWTFQIRAQARWSNGSPVTAHDFVSSWQQLCRRKNIGPNIASDVKRLLKIKLPLLNGWECYKGECPASALGVEAVDELNLRLTFTRPQIEPLLLECLTSPLLLPIPPQFIEGIGLMHQSRNLSAFMSNGPFQIVEFKPNKQVVLQKNPYYWDATHVKLSAVIYHACKDDKAQIRAWVDGTIDLMSMDQNIRIMEGEMRPYLTQQKWVPAHLIHYFLLNLQDPHLSKKKVRWALNLLMERHHWVKECFLDGAAQATYGVLEPGRSVTRALYIDWINLLRGVRVQRAQALLEKSGYTERHPLSLTVTYDWEDSSFKTAIGRDWNLPNLKVDFMRIEPGQRNAILNQREYQIMLNHEGFRTWSPLSFFQGFLGRQNHPTGYNSTCYDELLEKLQEAPDLNEFSRISFEVERMLLEDMPVLPWVYACKSWVARDFVQGLPLEKGMAPSGTVYSKYLFIRHRSG